MAFGGLIGLAAAFILAIEKVELLKDPSFEPSCNLNPILSCGSVMITPQAEAFGFPNPFLGILGFTAISVAGFALLAGATFKRWFWLCTLIGLALAVTFVHWLIFQTVYRIGSLCPYCMIVWLVTIPLFWYVLLHNIKQGHLIVPRMLRGVAGYTRRHHGDILLVWYLAIFGIIIYEFWYYWGSLLNF